MKQTLLRLPAVYLAAAVLLAGLPFGPTARAVTPAPGGVYANQDTALGNDALNSESGTGGNTALGFNALYANTDGFDNTATGAAAMYSNTTGGDNTACGYETLYNNTTGGSNTATGNQALHANTMGNGNTASGVVALYSNLTGNDNVASGADALHANTTGSDNVASGFGAMVRNTTGTANTASGFEALFSNTTGGNNAASGFETLYSNTSGGNNTADGSGAMYNTTTGNDNTASGADALSANMTGSDNTAVGFQALKAVTATGSNTAVGFNALDQTTGASNIALGSASGSNVTNGSNNIEIGSHGTNKDSATIRLGTPGTQTNAYVAGVSGVTVAGGVAVVVDSTGHLGTMTSSARFKENIAPMDAASESILALRPVTFRYKPELDPEAIPQFGLVAEEVEKVNPALVARDAEGKAYTVRYDAVNAMLLNEFLKQREAFLQERRRGDEQAAAIVELRSALARQQEATAALAARVATGATPNVPLPAGRAAGAR